MASMLLSRVGRLNYTASLPNPKVDDSVVTALCTSFIEGRNWDAVTREFRSLQLYESSVEHVLLRLNSPTHAKAALGFFHWASKRNTTTFQHTPRSYCIAIHLLLGANLLTDARALLESLAKTNTHPHTLVDSLLDTCQVSTSRSLAVNLFIQAFTKAKLTDVAFDVCRYVEEARGLSVSVVSFNALLHAAQRSHHDKCGLVWEVFEFMIRQRAYPNATSLRVMVDALCKEGELQKTVDTLDRIMTKRTFRSPSMIVHCALMLRILERGHESESGVVVLLKRLLQKNLLHETVVYSLIVHVKVLFGDLDSAWGLYMEMVERGFEGNAFVYNSFVGAFCRDRRIEEAVGLMREMEGKGLEPYGETLQHVVVGCAADSERLEECVRAFEEMVKVGFVPGCLVFNEVVGKLCEGGYVEKANEMLTVLLDRGFMPDDVTYCRLMQGYAEKREIQEVLKLYYEMEYRSVSPGLSVFSTIVQCLCRCGKVGDAERYFRIMKGRSVRPDVSVYEALIGGYMKMGDSARAICLREEMASLEL